MRVSILMMSPSLMNSGTAILAPVLISGRLGHAGRGVAAEPGLRRQHLLLDEVGQRDADGAIVEEQNLDDDLLGHVVRVVTDGLVRDLHLVVGARVHEHVRIPFLVQVLHLLRFDVGRLELLAGAQVALDDAAGEQVLELGAREGCALARLDELELDHGERIAVQHDLEPLADVGSVVRSHGMGGFSLPGRQGQPVPARRDPPRRRKGDL